MINIKNISVDGFKNLDDITIDFSKINVLLSTNNFGKSNFLLAIRFGFDFIVSPSNNKKTMMNWKAGIPINKKNLGRNFKFEITFESDSVDSKQIKYGFEFEWTRNKKSGAIVHEYLKIKDKTQKFVSYIDRNYLEAHYKTSPTGRCDKGISITESELVANKITAFDDLFYLDVVKEINNLKLFVDRHFDIKGLFEQLPFIEKGCGNFSPFAENSVPRTMYFLSKEHKNKYQLIVNTLKDFFSDIIDVSIKQINVSNVKSQLTVDENAPFEVEDFIYVLFVNSKNTSVPINIDLMSDGVKRILSLLVYMTLADIEKVPLIAIEEPENSVHPGLLKRYIDVIEGFIGDSKVLITSHSPYLINYVDLTNIYVGEPRGDGMATFKSITATGITKINRYSQEMGIQAGEYLFSILSSDDAYDINNLKKYLENA